MAVLIQKGSKGGQQSASIGAEGSSRVEVGGSRVAVGGGQQNSSIEAER